MIAFLPAGNQDDLKLRLKPFLNSDGSLETVDLPAEELDELKCEQS